MRRRRQLRPPIDWSLSYGPPDSYINQAKADQGLVDALPANLKAFVWENGLEALGADRTELRRNQADVERAARARRKRSYVYVAPKIGR